MHSQLRALNLFLASPGDLAEERRIARSVIDELNSSIGRPLGWRVELYGWEDSPIGAVRPQSQINEEVNQCDLFVGMLWERWGQPPGESDYKSGFEEELALARSRWTRNGQPEIWLFLKDIDPKLARDPGDQTKLVLAFRQRIREEQKLFYKEFRNADEWTQEFRKRLSRYLVTLAAAKAEPANPSSSPIRPEAQTPHENLSLERGENGVVPSTQQALDSIQAITKILRAGALSNFEAELPSEPALARLILVTSVFQAVRLPDELLGAHQANLIFRNRSQISPTKSEWLHLARSMLADQTQTIPGWAWIKPYSGFKDVILQIAGSDEVEIVAAGALRMIRELKLTLSKKDRLNLFAGLLRTRHESALIEGLRWLEAYGASTDQWFAKEAKAIASNDIRSAAEDAILATTQRENPTRALDELFASDHKHSESVIAQTIKALDTTKVQFALSHQSATVRKLAAIELFDRQAITRQIVSVLLADSDSAVQKIGVEAAIALGAPPSFETIKSTVKPTGLLAAIGSSASSEANELIVRVLRALPEPELRKKIDWFSPEGRLAYAALAQQHFQTFAPRLKADIADNFATLQKESSDAAIERLGEVGRRQVDTYEREGLNGFIRSEYLKAAIMGLARHGSAEDRALIEPLLKDADYHISPFLAEFLGRHGKPSDTKTILRLLEISWANNDILLSLAIKLSNEPSQLALDRSLNTQTRTSIIRKLTDEQILELKGEWVALLRDDNADIRKSLLLRIFGVTRASERKRLIEQLHSGSSYFYDTIYWLDRLSYPVSSWRVLFAESLSKHLMNPYRKDWLRE